MPALSRFDLSGRVAIVTGGTRGIGRAIAIDLARAGARVVVASRKPDAVARVAEEIRGEGGEAVGIAANVGRTDEALALVDRAIETFGGLDIVVNNAAANPVYGPLTEMTTAAFDKIIDVNLRAPLEISRRALPSLRERGHGAVINISSIGGISPEKGLGIYSASKAALISLTKVMADEWGAFGVRANAICPGFIRTDFGARLWADEGVVERVLAAQPIQRLGTPEDIAGLALFLASDAAAFCTGAVYLADGGYLL